MTKKYAVKMYGQVTKTLIIEAEDEEAACERAWEEFTLDVSTYENYEQDVIDCEELPTEEESEDA